jgi:predicted nucleotidyltransferase
MPALPASSTDPRTVSARLRCDTARLADFCRRWKITRLEAFGSVLRSDYRPDSDVDLLATFADDAHCTLFDRVRMRDELTAILGRPVDLVNRRAIERSRNWIRRAGILESAEPWYDAR